LHYLVWIGVSVLSLIWVVLLTFTIFCPIKPKELNIHEQSPLDNLGDESYEVFVDETVENENSGLIDQSQ
jgi:hypothetical protein